MPKPFSEARGRERFILTLWDTPQRGGALRMAFLYDAKQRSGDRTHDTISLAYIGEIKGKWLGVKDVKMDGPTKVSEPSYDYWRLDYSAPDQVPRYNSHRDHPVRSASPSRQSGRAIAKRTRRRGRLASANALRQEPEIAHTRTIRDLVEDRYGRRNHRRPQPALVAYC